MTIGGTQDNGTERKWVHRVIGFALRVVTVVTA